MTNNYYYTMKLDQDKSDPRTPENRNRAEKAIFSKGHKIYEAFLKTYLPLDHPGGELVGLVEMLAWSGWHDLVMDGAPELFLVIEYGVKKYSMGSWRHVPDATPRYLKALSRHLLEWADGWAEHRTLAIDEESGLQHAAHALCNLYFLHYFAKSGDAPC